jgi:hypothetical protein
VGEQDSDESSQSEQESQSSSSGSDEDAYARKINKPLRKKVSQEEKKGGIVKKLLGMNNQMRTFSREVESRLDKVYTKGAGKKYGYDDITNQSMAQVSLPGSSSESRYEDRMLKKI